MSENNIKYSKTKIGIFDSGVGGLSILKVLANKMPHDDFIYFGDTKNIPYGTKSKEEIIEFGRNTIKFFIKKNVKNIVIACNTSSALAYDTLKNEFKNVNIYPLIQSVAPEIAKFSNISVLATIGTVNSGKYKNEILKYNTNAVVNEIPSKDFVYIVENRLYNDTSAIKSIEKTLALALKNKPQKIVLGCTHYPYLINVFKNFVSEDIFIDPADIFSEKIIKELMLKQEYETTKNKRQIEFWVSGKPDNFIENAKIFYEIKTMVKTI